MKKSPSAIVFWVTLSALKNPAARQTYSSSLLKASTPGFLSGTRTMHLVLECNKHPFSLTIFAIWIEWKINYLSLSDISVWGDSRRRVTWFWKVTLSNTACKWDQVREIICRLIWYLSPALREKDALSSAFTWGNRFYQRIKVP